ncbi:U1 zinc finger protein (macronuclear) [Tetrahymena thermophila SB210]|uniref:U1 zinc finger protein n=1 Tax=Tetrahymena thermophila (strain SB210) TaxID=312017 RepID=Q22NU5_TETTS|nr:U1 zinc finger protein [Tetrahymena thermophila SB210]EAR87066.2 U1 zinc finger protein [Tetrahymena thermophila SB210]|eukprot:XP_001007311.2 U1 zinc finger protein [Tetrahymena thermophila SB210]
MKGNKYFIYDKDQRNQEIIQTQSKIINQLCDKNKQTFDKYVSQQLFQIENNLKNQEKQEVVQMNFDDGRYVFYRDNYKNHKHFEFQNKCIILIQGIPGGVYYYSRLEKGIGNNFCRVINFYVPGLDKKDERRGNYRGTLDGLIQLINDFMENLKIEKAIFVMHSVGGLIGKSFAAQKPQRVEALVQIATVPITKWNGIRLCEQIEQKFYSLNDSITSEVFFSNQFREQFKVVHDQSKQVLDNLSKQEKELLGPILQFNFLDTLNFLKLRLSYPGRIFEVLHRMRQVDKKIPRMFVYSSQDQLMQQSLQEEEIFLFVVGQDAVKRRITKKIDNQMNLDEQNFSANYIFRYDDATHIVQHEKGTEIGILIKHFVSQLQLTEIIIEKSKL